MTRKFLRLLTGCALSLGLGLGGWGVWRLWVVQQHTAWQLRDTQTSLAESRKTLTMVEAEHRKLSEAYDTLRTRSSQTDEELARLKETSAKLTQNVHTLTTDRADLKRQFEEAKTQTDRLNDQVDSLKRDYAAVAAKKTALEGQLSHVVSAVLTPAEVEQLQRAFSHQQDEENRLRDQLAVLSHAHEQMVQEWALLEQQLAEVPRSRRQVRVGRVAAAPPPQELQQAAARYRNLGDAYLASSDYPKAAEAFEHALTLKEDPEVHARLAFIYGRLLNDSEKARLHTALASSARSDPTVTAMGSVASAQGLPRKGWRLVWDWLTQ